MVTKTRNLRLDEIPHRGSFETVKIHHEGKRTSNDPTIPYQDVQFLLRLQGTFKMVEPANESEEEQFQRLERAWLLCHYQNGYELTGDAWRARYSLA